MFYKTFIPNIVNEKKKKLLLIGGILLANELQKVSLHKLRRVQKMDIKCQFIYFIF